MTLVHLSVDPLSETSSPPCKLQSSVLDVTTGKSSLMTSYTANSRKYNLKQSVQSSLNSNLFTHMCYLYSTYTDLLVNYLYTRSICPREHCNIGLNLIPVVCPTYFINFALDLSLSCPDAYCSILQVTNRLEFPSVTSSISSHFILLSPPVLLVISKTRKRKRR